MTSSSVDRQEFFEKTYTSGYVPPDGWWVSPFKRFSLHRERAVAQLLPGGHRFLDIGCGIGDLALSVADRYDEVQGVDIAPSRIGQANLRAEQAGKPATFIVGNVETGLPYPNGYFDALTCVATFEFLIDPYRAMREFHRLLATGGICIVQVPNIAFIVHRLRLLTGRFPVTSKQVGWDGGTLHYFTVGSLTRLFEETDFCVTARSNSGVFAALRRCWMTVLSSDVIVRAAKR